MNEKQNEKHPDHYQENTNYFDQLPEAGQMNSQSAQEGAGEEAQIPNTVESQEIKDTGRNNQNEVADDPAEGSASENSPIQGKQDTEFAAEAAVINPHETKQSLSWQNEKKTHMTVRTQQGWGWLALGIAVIALFIWPMFFGTVAILAGVYAIRRNARVLGNAAIILGLFAVMLRLIFVPLI